VNDRDAHIARLWTLIETTERKKADRFLETIALTEEVNRLNAELADAMSDTTLWYYGHQWNVTEEIV